LKDIRTAKNFVGTSKQGSLKNQGFTAGLFENTSLLDNCRRTSRVLGEEIRPRHAFTPRITLAEGSRGDPVPYLAESLQPTGDVDARRRLRSADSMTLVEPATRCSTLGDRAIPVSAARTWNALPSGVRAAPSLASFRQKLKQTLFLQSFSDE